MNMTYDYIGWAKGRQATLFSGEVWHSDPGYTLLFALCRLPATGAIQFDSGTVELGLANGSTVRPVGVALSLDETFRCSNGQKSPMVLPTGHAGWRQDSGNCYALVFSLWAGDVPRAFSLDGRHIPAGDMLKQEPAPTSPGGPPRTQGQATSATSLADGLPFCYRSDAPMPLTGFRPPAPAFGVVLVANCGETSVVVVRIPPEMASNGNALTENGIYAKLRDGTTVPSTGLVLRTGMRESPYGCADHYRVGVSEKTLSAGGKLMFMLNYPGPYSTFSKEECKLALAFPTKADWQSIQAICLPGFESSYPNGTAVLDL